MATKKRKASKGEAQPRSPKKELLVRIHERFKIMSEADDENRREGIEDLKFVNVPGYQWDDNMKKERGNRPCYEFNKLRINGKRVINEIRANRPQGKVRAVEGGDKEGAELREGLCRNIANMSDFDTITDQAAEYQVDAGMAAWRVVTEYADDSMFDQDILIKSIKNPFCLYADPACQDILKRDAEDWILTERIANKAYEAKYGKVEKIDFEEGEFDDEDVWADGETVRVCEYWWKEPYDKEIWLVELPRPDGTTERLTVDSTTDEAAALVKQGVKPVKTRTARCHRIMMCVASGEAILEGPVEWAGSQFPFVMIYGEYKIVDGKTKWHGLHRFSKDAQRSYNVARTSIDETIAQAPQAKYWATPEQAKGHTGMWSEAHKKNFPFLLFNPDPKQPGAPQRMGGPDVPVALIQQTMVSSQDIRDTSGLHEASFGEESQEKSGIALARKQHQAQIVTYNFPDNMAKGVKRTWEIVLDLIPEIYDAERELRIIGQDGAEDYKRINQLVFDPSTGETVRVNDMSAGKYDVTVTVGPSFSTLRQEAAEVYGELGAKNPALMQVAGDLVFKSLDYPYADEIAKRWQTILPPPIQKMLSEGKELPPEAQAVMAQAEQAMQMVQQQTALVQQAAQEVQQDQAKSEKAKADVEKAIANLKTAEAQFEAKVAKAMADLSKRETLLQAQEMAHGQEKQDAEGLLSSAGEAREAVQAIDEMVAQFMEAMAQAVAVIEAKSGIKIVMPSPRAKSVSAGPGGMFVDYDEPGEPLIETNGVPMTREPAKRSRVKGIRTERVNGVLVAIPEYEGESDEPRIARVRAERRPDGSLVGVPEYEAPTIQ